jgi:predicted nucleotidyltransferase component of viral defense system
MIDNGYDLMHAMQDAMDEKKFMLVLTLLSKTPDDDVVQSKNKKGQNLFHILSMNASSCAQEHL